MIQVGWVWTNDASAIATPRRLPLLRVGSWLMGAVVSWSLMKLVKRG